jgi:hypothetical protein
MYVRLNIYMWTDIVRTDNCYEKNKLIMFFGWLLLQKKIFCNIKTITLIRLLRYGKSALVTLHTQ